MNDPRNTRAECKVLGALSGRVSGVLGYHLFIVDAAKHQLNNWLAALALEEFKAAFWRETLSGADSSTSLKRLFARSRRPEGWRSRQELVHHAALWRLSWLMDGGLHSARVSRPSINPGNTLDLKTSLGTAQSFMIIRGRPDSILELLRGALSNNAVRHWGLFQVQV